MLKLESASCSSTFGSPSPSSSNGSTASNSNNNFYKSLPYSFDPSRCSSLAAWLAPLKLAPRTSSEPRNDDDEEEDAEAEDENKVEPSSCIVVDAPRLNPPPTSSPKPENEEKKEHEENQKTEKEPTNVKKREKTKERIGKKKQKRKEKPKSSKTKIAKMAKKKRRRRLQAPTEPVSVSPPPHFQSSEGRRRRRRRSSNTQNLDPHNTLNAKVEGDQNGPMEGLTRETSVDDAFSVNFSSALLEPTAHDVMSLEMSNIGGYLDPRSFGGGSLDFEDFGQPSSSLYDLTSSFDTNEKSFDAEDLKYEAPLRFDTSQSQFDAPRNLSTFPVKTAEMGSQFATSSSQRISTFVRSSAGTSTSSPLAAPRRSTSSRAGHKKELLDPQRVEDEVARNVSQILSATKQQKLAMEAQQRSGIAPPTPPRFGFSCLHCNKQMTSARNLQRHRQVCLPQPTAAKKLLLPPLTTTSSSLSSMLGHSTSPPIFSSAPSSFISSLDYKTGEENQFSDCSRSDSYSGPQSVGSERNNHTDGDDSAALEPLSGSNMRLDEPSSCQPLSLDLDEPQATRSSSASISSNSAGTPQSAFTCESCKKSVSSQRSLKRHHTTCKAYIAEFGQPVELNESGAGAVATSAAAPATSTTTTTTATTDDVAATTTTTTTSRSGSSNSNSSGSVVAKKKPRRRRPVYSSRRPRRSTRRVKKRAAYSPDASSDDPMPSTSGASPSADDDVKREPLGIEVSAKQNVTSPLTPALTPKMSTATPMEATTMPLHVATSSTAATSSAMMTPQSQKHQQSSSSSPPVQPMPTSYVNAYPHAQQQQFYAEHGYHPQNFYANSAIHVPPYARHPDPYEMYYRQQQQHQMQQAQGPQGPEGNNNNSQPQHQHQQPQRMHPQEYLSPGYPAQSVVYHQPHPQAMFYQHQQLQRPPDYYYPSYQQEQRPIYHPAPFVAPPILSPSTSVGSAANKSSPTPSTSGGLPSITSSSWFSELPATTSRLTDPLILTPPMSSSISSTTSNISPQSTHGDAQQNQQQPTPTPSTSESLCCKCDGPVEDADAVPGKNGPPLASNTCEDCSKQLCSASNLKRHRATCKVVLQQNKESREGSGGAASEPQTPRPTSVATPPQPPSVPPPKSVPPTPTSLSPTFTKPLVHPLHQQQPIQQQQQQQPPTTTTTSAPLTSSNSTSSPWQQQQQPPVELGARERSIIDRSYAAAVAANHEARQRASANYMITTTEPAAKPWITVGEHLKAQHVQQKMLEQEQRIYKEAPTQLQLLHQQQIQQQQQQASPGMQQQQQQKPTAQNDQPMHIQQQQSFQQPQPQQRSAQNFQQQQQQVQNTPQQQQTPMATTSNSSSMPPGSKPQMVFEQRNDYVQITTQPLPPIRAATSTSYQPIRILSDEEEDDDDDDDFDDFDMEMFNEDYRIVQQPLPPVNALSQNHTQPQAMPVQMRMPQQTYQQQPLHVQTQQQQSQNQLQQQTHQQQQQQRLQAVQAAYRRPSDAVIESKPLEKPMLTPTSSYGQPNFHQPSPMMTHSPTTTTSTTNNPGGGTNATMGLEKADDGRETTSKIEIVPDPNPSIGPLDSIITTQPLPGDRATQSARFASPSLPSSSTSATATSAAGGAAAASTPSSSSSSSTSTLMSLLASSPASTSASATTSSAGPANVVRTASNVDSVMTSHPAGMGVAGVNYLVGSPKKEAVIEFQCPECFKMYSCRKNVKRHRMAVHKLTSDEIARNPAPGALVTATGPPPIQSRRHTLPAVATHDGLHTSQTQLVHIQTHNLPQSRDSPDLHTPNYYKKQPMSMESDDAWEPWSRHSRDYIDDDECAETARIAAELKRSAEEEFAEFEGKKPRTELAEADTTFTEEENERSAMNSMASTPLSANGIHVHTTTMAMPSLTTLTNVSSATTPAFRPSSTSIASSLPAIGANPWTDYEKVEPMPYDFEPMISGSQSMGVQQRQQQQVAPQLRRATPSPKDDDSRSPTPEEKPERDAGGKRDRLSRSRGHDVAVKKSHMCSYCNRVLSSDYSLRRHKSTCPELRGAKSNPSSTSSASGPTSTTVTRSQTRPAAISIPTDQNALITTGPLSTTKPNTRAQAHAQQMKESSWHKEQGEAVPDSTTSQKADRSTSPGLGLHHDEYSLLPQSQSSQPMQTRRRAASGTGSNQSYTVSMTPLLSNGPTSTDDAQFAAGGGGGSGAATSTPTTLRANSTSTTSSMASTTSPAAPEKQARHHCQTNFGSGHLQLQGQGSFQACGKFYSSEWNLERHRRESCPLKEKLQPPRHLTGKSATEIAVPRPDQLLIRRFFSYGVMDEQTSQAPSQQSQSHATPHATPMDEVVAWVGSVRVHLSRSVLSRASPYFAQLLAMHDAARGDLRIDADSAHFQTILDLLHCRTTITQHNIDVVTELARRFKFGGIFEACERFIGESLPQYSIMHAIRLAEQFKMQTTKTQLFDSISLDVFRSLSADQHYRLMDSDLKAELLEKWGTFL